MVGGSIERVGRYTVVGTFTETRADVSATLRALGLGAEAALDDAWTDAIRMHVRQKS